MLMAETTTEPRLVSENLDAVLALALGALSMANGLEAALRPQSTDGEALQPDDPVVLAALGAIALGRTLRRWLEESADAVVTSTPSTHPRPLPRELLR